MKKLLGLSLLLGMCLVGSKVEAAGATRGAKTTLSLNYTTTVSTVTTGPGVLYQVILASGTAGTDFTALFDTATVQGILTASNTALKTRVITSSATQNTVITFDPPLQFNNGIVAGNSASTSQAIIVFEKGRVTSGY